MRVNIAPKLFIGFLVIIFLNVFLFVIVDKTQDLKNIAKILRIQNEIKNSLIRIKTLHNSQDVSAYSFARVGKIESAENFYSVNKDIVSDLDSILILLQAADSLDPSDKYGHGSYPKPDLNEHIQSISTCNITYNNIFDTLVYVSSDPDAKERTVDLRNAMEETDEMLLRKIESTMDAVEYLAHSHFEEIETRVANVRRITIIIFGGMTLFSILFGLFFSKAITNSLRRLKEAAAIIAKGNFNMDVSGYPNDEIGDLAFAFQSMSLDLKNAQEELIQKRRLAAIGEIVASVNHEINNPLMIISGNAQFLELTMEGYPSEIRERIRAILEETERIGQVTKKLREIKNPVVEDYTSSGEQMINLDKSS
ncbi:MAG: HAMP domain-containing protein [Chitinispirillaceae bacterium]